MPLRCFLVFHNYHRDRSVPTCSPRTQRDDAASAHSAPGTHGSSLRPPHVWWDHEVSVAGAKPQGSLAAVWEFPAVREGAQLSQGGRADPSIASSGLHGLEHPLRNHDLLRMYQVW